MKWIASIPIEREAAEIVAQRLRNQGFSARIYPRSVRAAALAVTVYVVVGDDKKPPVAP